MMAGMLIAILSYRTIYDKMYHVVDVKNKTEITEKATSTSEVKTNKDGSMDSVYTYAKVYTDGTTRTETITRSYTKITQLY
jgi:hypothetical protein